MPDLETRYTSVFQKLTGSFPFSFQQELALSLFRGENVVLRAPTGAGKTWSVLVPFLSDLWLHKPAKLIYVLPLRTLAESIYAEARDLFTKAERKPEEVTIQTGEQPDDPFFDSGRVIVATYDQLLSGLLESPYGLPDRLHNVNAASIAGSLIVFDEFHLMEPQRAFMTSTAMLKMFEGLCQSVWMTATATDPLVHQLHQTLNAVTVPRDNAAWNQLLSELPSVNSVKRTLRMRKDSLNAPAIVEAHQTVSLVIANTVDRAQELYGGLLKEREHGRLDAELIQLHSRFFRSDRRAKEIRLRQLFGKNPKRSAILIATQVVEAGIDISCENLHTELCPMNGLVQRAGRCARYPGQHGTVHVYALPAQDQSWLPYGTRKAEDITLTATRSVLTSMPEAQLDPALASEWVQVVHAHEDALAIRDGVQQRLIQCRDAIETRAIQRQHVGVSQLIREPDTDQIRTLICDAEHLPDSPARREAVGVSRWRLMHLMDGHDDVGWHWDWANEDQPWQPLRTREDVRAAQVVCLKPSVANYSGDVGLRLGQPGTEYSPFRKPPERPGHAPLTSESWSAHALNVAEESRRRVRYEGDDSALLSWGFANRYGLTFGDLVAAASAAGLLHDLGKLQADWQRWAEAAQRSKNETYVHSSPLAHTDFDRDKPEDVQRERHLRDIGIIRPHHAAASSFYGRAIVGSMVESIHPSNRGVVASAILAAVVAHHGGWWPLKFRAPTMWPSWEAQAEQTYGWAPEPKQLERLAPEAVDQLVGATTSADNLMEYWPLVAYLTRTLRLADQRATAESGAHE